MKRLTGVGFFVGLLVLLSLVSSREARAQTHIWDLVVIDATGDVGLGLSMAVDANGDLMVSYRDETNESLKFAICDSSASTNGSCDQADDWSTVTVDEMGMQNDDYSFTSIAVDANGDPMIAYYVEQPYGELRVAICDLSESTNGNCDQTDDWSTVTVDATGGQCTSIAVDNNGDPMISYTNQVGTSLSFATCDLSASTNGNCDQADDWSKASVHSVVAPSLTGLNTSIAVDANGDPVISYGTFVNLGFLYNLWFAICDLSESTNGNCDQTDDWNKVAADAAGSVGSFTSIAVDANGDPAIAYYRFGAAELLFAICDLSASANGNCDQGDDWNKVTVDPAGGALPSIAVDANGDLIVSHYDPTNDDLRFAACDLSASTNGNCDQAGDWSTETVDATGDVGYGTSIAVNANGEPIIAYYDKTNGDLKLAVASPAPEPVGGIAELPDVGESSAAGYIVLAGAAALAALGASAWYARRRWNR
jgi:hypothetical protein